MLSAIYEGALVPFDTALRIEARWFTQVLMNPSSARDDPLALPQQAGAREGRRAAPPVPDQSVRKLGVLGAGMMGAGIAYVAAQAGIEVVLIDRDQAAADKGSAHAEALLDERRQAQADDPREGGRGARPHHRHPRLRRASPAATWSSRRCSRTRRSRPRRPAAPRRTLPRRRDLRHQHLDPADQRARQGQPRARSSSSASTSSRRSTR